MYVHDYNTDMFYRQSQFYTVITKIKKVIWFYHTSLFETFLDLTVIMSALFHIHSTSLIDLINLHKNITIQIFSFLLIYIKKI